jgi:dihydroorotase
MPSVVSRAIVMPNLKPPVKTGEDAKAYEARILAALPPNAPGVPPFTPLMTIYLTDLTTAADVHAAHAAGVKAAKLYPAGATTNSDSGVTDVARVHDALHALQDLDMPLLVHGEVTDPTVDVFEREPVFLERILTPLVTAFPGLKLVLEHITTKEAVAFVNGQGPNVAATITAHHLLYNRNGV